MVFDFYDRLKSVSRGYASFDYHLTDYRVADLVKLQMLVNGDPSMRLPCLCTGRGLSPVGAQWQRS